MSSHKFEHYHYLGLPVLDAEGKLVGVVKASDALEIARKEATEDMQLRVGLSGEERALTAWNISARRRLPWLFINLATAFLAAGTVGLFEGTIANWTALAIFLLIIAGQGGNAGMQTLTVIVRDLALGELTSGDGRKALIKEIILALVNGVAIGSVVGTIVGCRLAKVSCVHEAHQSNRHRVASDFCVGVFRASTPRWHRQQARKTVAFVLAHLARQSVYDAGVAFDWTATSCRSSPPPFTRATFATSRQTPIGATASTWASATTIRLTKRRRLPLKCCVARGRESFARYLRQGHR